MMPGLSVFLDVEDLEDISDLQGYIDRSQTILVYCSKGYFQSKNCMIELRSTVMKKKPIIALMDPESGRGGLTKEEVHTELVEADASYVKWEFDNDGPRGEALYTALFQIDYIEWNRIGCFQDVTLRLVAERLLPMYQGVSQRLTYVQGETIHKKPALKKPSSGKKFHVYCSPLNPGAAELMEEVVSGAGHLRMPRDVTFAIPTALTHRRPSCVRVRLSNARRLCPPAPLRERRMTNLSKNLAKEAARSHAQ